MRPFFPALLLIGFILCTAPFMGLLRREAFDVVPTAALALLFLLLAIPAAALAVYSLLRIRKQPPWCFATLIAAAAFVWLQLTMTLGDGDVTVSLVERTHIAIYGLLSWLFYQSFRRKEVEDLSLLFLPLLLTAAAGALDEGVQFVVSTRLGDIHDVKLDALAGVAGVLVGLSLHPPRAFHWRIDRPRRLTDGLAFTLLVIGLFYANAHLGYLIHDPEIGSFRSWSTREQLLETAEDRARRWAIKPPRISPTTLEDLYLTEAGWHVNYRDICYQRQRFDLARHANLILETYYAPYLDLENFHGTHRRRYGPQVLKELAAHPIDPEGFVSPVLSRRVFLWPPKRSFLSGLLVVVGLLWMGPRVRERFTPKT